MNDFVKKRLEDYAKFIDKSQGVIEIPGKGSSMKWGVKSKDGHEWMFITDLRAAYNGLRYGVQNTFRLTLRHNYRNEATIDTYDMAHAKIILDALKRKQVETLALTNAQRDEVLDELRWIHKEEDNEGMA